MDREANVTESSFFTSFDEILIWLWTSLDVNSFLCWVVPGSAVDYCSNCTAQLNDDVVSQLSACLFGGEKTKKTPPYHWKSRPTTFKRRLHIATMKTQFV
jgi:hypothetical protein